MKDLFDKISSYNIVNYLFPGTLFAFFIDALSTLDVLQEDITVSIFLYYFLGSVVSRVGSLLVEPLLRKWKIVEFAPYENFVRASMVDTKIELLSEVNNMYRTICSLMLCVSIVVLYDMAANRFEVFHTVAPTVLIISIFCLYLFSYRKQTKYIMKRIEASNNQNGGGNE